MACCVVQRKIAQMRRFAPSLLGLLLLIPTPAPAQDAPELNATYEMYAGGLHVAEVSASFSLTPTQYAIRLAYHTTGLVSLFRHGYQMNRVDGVWNRNLPQPEQFEGSGVWGGDDNATLIDYVNGQPVIERLVSPPADKREPVPPALQANSVDSLSALALLIHRVQTTGRCEASVHTFDGRRASEISARTVGEEILEPSSLSMFTGRAVRCDFVGQMLAGFLDRSGPADRYAAARLGLARHGDRGCPAGAGADGFRDPVVRRGAHVPDTACVRTAEGSCCALGVTTRFVQNCTLSRQELEHRTNLA